MVDFNADGLLDLVVINRRAAMEVYQNATEAGNWLSVDLNWKNSNVDAIGSWVELEVNGVTQTQERTIGGGHVSGVLAPMHFGLGDNDQARVRVIWPDGKTSDWQSVNANSALTINR